MGITNFVKGVAKSKLIPKIKGKLIPKVKDKLIKKGYTVYIQRFTDIKNNVDNNIYTEEDTLFLEGVKHRYIDLKTRVAKQNRNNPLKRKQETKAWDMLIETVDDTLKAHAEEDKEIVKKGIDALIETLQLSVKQK